MTAAERPVITVYGSTSCEDTAITTSRLRAWAVPFLDVDVDADEAGLAEAVALVGHRVTPTVTVADTTIVATEPSLESLAGIARAAGWDVVAPQPRQLHGDLTARAIPSRSLSTDADDTFRLTSLRGRRQAILHLAHDATCLPCFGYARQLVARRAEADELDTEVVVVVTGTPEAAGGWRHAIDPAVPIVADPDATWKTAVADHLGVPGGEAFVLVVDRYGAPRAVSAAPEAGGCLDPSEAISWARFVALDCPECSGELPWPVD